MFTRTANSRVPALHNAHMWDFYFRVTGSVFPLAVAHTRRHAQAVLCQAQTRRELRVDSNRLHACANMSAGTRHTTRLMCTVFQYCNT